MSLTFNRPPPLAPSAHLQLPISTLGRDLMPQSPPPLSPLNTSPPHSAFLSPSQPSSPVTFPSGQAMRGTRAVPAPQLFGPGHTYEMQTPFNTPATPRRNAPILARPSVSRPTSSGGIGTVPSSLSTPLGEARPLNTVSAMRGRGIGIGAVLSTVSGTGVLGRSVGIPSAGLAASAGDVAHAATPGNTPSSMERISKRMAKNLIHRNQAGGTGGANKIMPSYDGRFRAGLSDLGNRLDEHVESGLRSPPQTMSPSMSGANAPFLGGSVKAEWPTQFGDASEDDEPPKTKKG